MKRIKSVRTLNRVALAAFGLLLMILTFPGTAFADPNPPSPLSPGSNVASDVANLFWLTITIGIVVFFIVMALLTFVIIRYRRRDEDEIPEQVHGNTTLELVWTVIPALIMLVLFGLTLDLLFKQEQVPADAMVIEVVGRQWFWDIEYPETGVRLRNEVVIPAGRPVAFEITSADVIHSFWIPELSGKMDAVPGHTNLLWFVAEPGQYAGQCAEFCGLEHYAMLFDVTVLPEQEYLAWEEEQVFIASQFTPVYPDPAIELDPTTLILPIGDAAAGDGKFVELGCNSCHSLDGTVLVGPSLQGYAARAEGRSAEWTAEQYTIDAILRPCDFVVGGFQCVMPQNFGTLLEEQDLANLIAYLLDQ